MTDRVDAAVNSMQSRQIDPSLHGIAAEAQLEELLIVHDPVLNRGEIRQVALATSRWLETAKYAVDIHLDLHAPIVARSLRRVAR